jgi:hypothetical protein
MNNVEICVLENYWCNLIFFFWKKINTVSKLQKCLESEQTFMYVLQGFSCWQKIYKFLHCPGSTQFPTHAKICLTDFCLICIYIHCIWAIYTCSRVIILRLTAICSTTTFLKMPVLVHDLFHFCHLADCIPFSNSCKDNYPETPLDTNSGRPTVIFDWSVSDPGVVILHTHRWTPITRPASCDILV